MTEFELEKTVEGLTKISSTLLDELITLKKEKTDLESRLYQAEQTQKSLLELQRSMMNALDGLSKENAVLQSLITRTGDNIPYELGMGRVHVPKIAEIEETVFKIVSERCSISRYGDGEFSIMMGESRQGFQHQDEGLSERLRTIIRINEPGFIVAIADNYSSLDKFSEISRKEIRYYMTDAVRNGHNKFMNEGQLYYNAYITTPYQLSKTKNDIEVKQKFDKLKEIWNGRELIIVEGELSRLGVGNDLFEKAKSIERILCPAEHAYDRYKDILNNSIVLGKEKKEPLFVIALGPTATVLAYDLHVAGFQACDLGHIDTDYEFWKRKSPGRCVIPGKYINNLTSVNDVEDVQDENYLKQIRIKVL